MINGIIAYLLIGLLIYGFTCILIEKFYGYDSTEYHDLIDHDMGVAVVITTMWPYLVYKLIIKRL